MDMVTQVQLTWQRSLLNKQFCFCSVCVCVCVCVHVCVCALPLAVWVCVVGCRRGGMAMVCGLTQVHEYTGHSMEWVSVCGIP